MVVLALAANSATTNVEQMGDAIKFVAPVAAAFSVSIEESAAAVGALSNAGLQATLAGTGLRRILAELEAPSSKTRKILDKLGLTVEDVQVSSVGLTGALRALKDAGFGGIEALSVFGQRGGPAAIALLESIDFVEELTENLENAAGTADRVAKIMDDNLFGALKAVASAGEAVLLAFGDSGATGVLEGFFRTVADGLRFLARNIEIVQGLLIGIAIVTLPLLISGVLALAAAIAATGLGLVIVLLGVATGALIAFKDEIKLTADGAGTLGDFLVVAFEEISIAVEEFTNTFIQAVGPILNALGLVVEGTQNDFQTILLSAARLADRFIGVFVGIAAALGAVFEEGVDLPRTFQRLTVLILNGIVGILEVVSDNITAFLVAIGRTAQQTALQFNTAFINLAEASRQAFAGNFEAARKFAEDGIHFMGIAASDAGDLFVTNFTTEVDRLGEIDVLAKIEGPLKDDAEDLGASVGEAFLKGFNETTGNQDLVNRVLEGAEFRGQARESASLLEEFRRSQTEANREQGITEDVDPKKTAEEITTSLQGFLAGFEEVGGIIDNFGDQAQATIVNAFGAAEDALVEFVQTGEFNFSKLVDSILADLTRLAFRQALFALLGGGTGAGTANAASALAGARQHGGPVTSGRPFLVGERGPELFNPPSAGNIVPNNQLGGAPGPVNVTIINQTSREEILETINSPEGENVIVNTISRKRRAVRETLQT